MVNDSLSAEGLDALELSSGEHDGPESGACLLVEAVAAMNGRPEWVEAVQRYVSDTVIMDESLGFPGDGSEDALHDDLETAMYDVLCGHYGHDVVDDQCGRPEHRFCAHCGRRESDL